MSYREQAEELYEQNYKGRGLAPKHVVALKDVLTKALKKGEKPKVAAKRFFKEKGIELETGDKADTESVEKETKTEEKKKETKTEEKKEAPKIDFSQVDLRNLDRKSLKATIVELHNAGVKVNVPFDGDGTPRVKKLEDAQLIHAVSEALNSLPSPETMAMLESIDTRKLPVQDCLGLFVDLRTPECLMCPDKATCVKTFITNLKGDFSVFKPAMLAIKTAEAATQITDEEADAVSKKSKDEKKKAKVKRLKYDPDLTVFIMNTKNPEKKSSDAYEMVQEILNYVEDATFAPIALSALLEIVNNSFEYDKNGFMEELLPQLRDEGIIKYQDDLTDEEREAYEEALKNSESDDD